MEQQIVSRLDWIAADLAANAVVSVGRSGDFYRVAGHLIDAEDSFRCYGCGGNACEHSAAARLIEQAIEKARRMATQGQLEHYEKQLVFVLSVDVDDLLTLNSLHVYLKAAWFVAAQVALEASAWEMEVAA
jgi:hypothetical protein